MIVLHNSYDGASLEFVRLHTGPGDEIYDWYKGGREAWAAKGGTMHVSAFPSVIVDIPTFLVDKMDSERNVIGTIQLDAEQVALRQVLDVAEVSAFLADQNKRLAKSKTLGLTPSPQTLTLDNLNQVDTGRG